MKLEDFMKHEVNRRRFLETSAKNAAGVAAAGMAAGLVAFSTLEARAAANDRVSLAVIGVRGQGQSLATGFAALPDVDVVAVCDVDDRVAAEAASAVEKITGKAPRKERDFRRLLEDQSIQAVAIATPDHWHAPMTVMACQAGKDVYVEKPVSHNIAEGTRMVEAARKFQRVVQSGTQQRSGSHFQSAVDYVKSGKLGTVKFAKAWTIHVRKAIGKGVEGPAPREVDYDLWLGPAPQRAFQPNRFHYNWRWFWDYGTGEMGNWGVHMLDIARWGLGVELPTRVSAAGGKYLFDDDQETPDTQVVNYTFSGATITWEHRLWSPHGLEGRSAAAAFYGDKGTLVVDRGGWKVYDTQEPATSDTSDQANAHYRNFIDCIKSRGTPVADIEIGHITSALCHLGNISYRLGRDVEFRPEHMDFGTDAAANALLTREYRKGWELPTV